MKTGYAAWRHRLQWAGALWLSLMTSLVLAQAVPNVTTSQRTVLVMGDSLSAAYGLDAAQGWVALTAQRIAQSKPGWRVVNASISGETTAGGAARIVGEVVRHRPAVVVIELGANDGLRGLPLRESRRNLARMIGAAQGIGAKVLLVGMRLPPNYGAAYTREFERGYRELAERFDTALLPFLLQPIATDRSAFQSDNLHPGAGAQRKLRDHVWPALEPLLHKAPADHLLDAGRRGSAGRGSAGRGSAGRGSAKCGTFPGDVDPTWCIHIAALPVTLFEPAGATRIARFHRGRSFCGRPFGEHPCH